MRINITPPPSPSHEKGCWGGAVLPARLMNARRPQNLWTGPAALSRALIMGTELGQWGAKKIY